MRIVFTLIFAILTLFGTGTSATAQLFSLADRAAVDAYFSDIFAFCDVQEVKEWPQGSELGHKLVKDMHGTYFPENSIDIAGNYGFLEATYEGVLIQMDEEPLGKSDGISIRIVEMPAFGPSLGVHLRIDHENSILSRKRIGTAHGVGSLDTSDTAKVPRDEVAAFMRLDPVEVVCNAPRSENVGADGVFVLFEVAQDGRQCATDRWVPDASDPLIPLQQRLFAMAQAVFGPLPTDWRHTKRLSKCIPAKR